MSFTKRVKQQMSKNSEVVGSFFVQQWRQEIESHRLTGKTYWDSQVPYLKNLLRILSERGIDPKADLRCRDAAVLISTEESRAERVVAAIPDAELEAEVMAARRRARKVSRDLFLGIDRIVEYLTEIDVEDPRLDAAILFVTRLRLEQDPVTLDIDSAIDGLAKAGADLIRDGLNRQSVARTLFPVTPIKKP